MKASSPQFAVFVTLLGLLATLLTGCGVATKNVALIQGNWSVSATSTKSANTILIGGNLTQSGSGLSGTMYITGSDVTCNFDPSKSVRMTGTVNGSNVALSSESIGGQVITVAASGSVSALSGTYSIAGGACDGDQGNVTANAVPSITGTWNGTVQVSGAPVTMSVALTQAAAASADGTFALTGTVTYTGSVCSSSATITTPSTIIGANVSLTANVGDGTFNYTGPLDSVTAPANMVGTYSTSDSCAGDPDQTVTLTKQ
jgi:hypothetical protein